MFGFRETFDIAETLTLILFCRSCCFVKCFEEDEESCLPKSAEVLVVIENMTIIIKLVRVYIYTRGDLKKSLTTTEGKKVFVCLVLRSPPSKLYVLVGFF